ncbi:Sulfate transporter 1.1 [Hibiscus syriacus]|uniref:Sulfate transporter 1.1 n=1 Tax=Hibiscus syriacus TaxID=106335 RepID=A0A6A3BKS1_HIBSY|nr:Sulfate transporter 1.1 [Hibiscus syriacus]
MMAIGAMNIVGSMTSCYVATGSFSRSAVNFMAGCETAVSNIVMSCVVFLTLEFITPLFKYTPNTILAAIIINAVVGLFYVPAAILIWKIDKFDFVACLVAFLGFIFQSVEIDLLIAVIISFAKILLQVTRPRTALLGKIPRSTVGIHAMEELHKSLQKKNVQLVLANPAPVVIEKLHSSKFTDIIGDDRIFLTVADAVSSCSPKWVEEEF